MKKFYAVQVGDNYDCDNGSTVKREAVKMANAAKRNHDNDGMEIRIVVCSTESDFVTEEIIIRDGFRG